MTAKHPTSGHESNIHVHGIPPDSEIPPAVPSPSLEEVVPHPDDDVGGMNNVAEELLPPARQVEDQLHHLGMEVERPGEDEALLEADQEEREVREHWGRL